MVIDKLFYLIFTLTSLIYWIPILLIFFIPFIILRKVKNKIQRTSQVLKNYSDRNLRNFTKWREMISLGRQIESTTKDIYQQYANKVYEKTVWWQRMEIIEETPYKARVLDVGCGNGYLAKLLTDTKKARVTCVDVDDFNQTDLPTVIFDGLNLPFKDREFDIVILSFVLHHSRFPEELLGEAARVCRGKILVYEDEAIRGGEDLMASVHQNVYGLLSGQSSKVTYHSIAGWQEIFDKHGLDILEQREDWGVGSFFIPLKRAVFVLQNKIKN